MYALRVRAYLLSVNLRGRPRVLLCEPDPTLAWLLEEVFGDEGLAVVLCPSLEDIKAALRRYPGAVVVCDAWSRVTEPDLAPDEHAAIVDLGERARLILMTTRPWALQPADASLGDRVTVIAKPFDLDALLTLVRRAVFVRAAGAAH